MVRPRHEAGASGAVRRTRRPLPPRGRCVRRRGEHDAGGLPAARPARRTGRACAADGRRAAAASGRGARRAPVRGVPDGGHRRGCERHARRRAPAGRPRRPRDAGTGPGNQARPLRHANARDGQLHRHPGRRAPRRDGRRTDALRRLHRDQRGLRDRREPRQGHRGPTHEHPSPRDTRAQRNAFPACPRRQRDGHRALRTPRVPDPADVSSLPGRVSARP
jgi:hypothetical protein